MLHIPGNTYRIFMYTVRQGRFFEVGTLGSRRVQRIRSTPAELYARAVPQDHPGSPRLGRRPPASRDNKAALTLGPVGGEAGADFCLLGKATWPKHHTRSPQGCAILTQALQPSLRYHSTSLVAVYKTIDACRCPESLCSQPCRGGCSTLIH